MLNLINNTFKVILVSPVLFLITGGNPVMAQATSEFKTIREQTQIRQNSSSEENSVTNPDGSGNSQKRSNSGTTLDSVRDERSFGATGDEATADENGARGIVRPQNQQTPAPSPFGGNSEMLPQNPSFELNAPGGSSITAPLGGSQTNQPSPDAGLNTIPGRPSNLRPSGIPGNQNPSLPQTLPQPGNGLGNFGIPAK